jgi:hypothetical protein
MTADQLSRIKKNLTKEGMEMWWVGMWTKGMENFKK